MLGTLADPSRGSRLILLHGRRSWCAPRAGEAVVADVSTIQNVASIVELTRSFVVLGVGFGQCPTLFLPPHPLTQVYVTVPRQKVVPDRPKSVATVASEKDTGRVKQ